MKKLLSVTGAAFALKLVTGFAIVATAAAVATEIAITGSVNPTAWGRHVNHQVTLTRENGPAASAPQPGGSQSTASAGSATAQGTVNTNDNVRDNGKASRPTTTWFTEPNDPPLVAVQTKFIPKP